MPEMSPSLSFFFAAGVVNLMENMSLSEIYDFSLKINKKNMQELGQFFCDIVLRVTDKPCGQIFGYF